MAKLPMKYDPETGKNVLGKIKSDELDPTNTYDADTLDGQHGSYYLNRANHTGTQTASTISDFEEAAQDAIGNAVSDTNSIDMNYDDVDGSIKADLRLKTNSGMSIEATGTKINVDNQSIEIDNNILRSLLDSSGAIVKSVYGIRINIDNVTLEISSNILKIKSEYKNKRYSTKITGDGATTNFVLTHNVANADANIEVIEETTGYTVYTLIERTGVNQATIIFKIAPALNKRYSVIVIG